MKFSTNKKIKKYQHQPQQQLKRMGCSSSKPSADKPADVPVVIASSDVSTFLGLEAFHFSLIVSLIKATAPTVDVLVAETAEIAIAEPSAEIVPVSAGVDLTDPSAVASAGADAVTGTAGGVVGAIGGLFCGLGNFALSCDPNDVSNGVNDGYDSGSKQAKDLQGQAVAGVASGVSVVGDGVTSGVSAVGDGVGSVAAAVPLPPVPGLAPTEEKDAPPEKNAPPEKDAPPEKNAPPEKDAPPAPPAEEKKPAPKQ